MNWAAAELNLPTLADSGYEGAGHSIKTPTKQPTDGKPLAVAERSANLLLRGLRWQGERGFAILVGLWKAIRHNTISPRRIGDVVAAALYLTHFEYRHLTNLAEITSLNESDPRFASSHDPRRVDADRAGVVAVPGPSSIT